MPDRNDIVCVDFDGVIHSYTGYRSSKVDGDPIDGAFNFLKMLLDNSYKVVILSARAGDEDQKKMMYQWFKDKGFDQVDRMEITAVKPSAKMYIDDRAWLFTGSNFPTAEEVDKFTPWWRKDIGAMNDTFEIGEMVARASNAARKARECMIAFDNGAMTKEQFDALASQEHGVNPAIQDRRRLINTIYAAIQDINSANPAFATARGVTLDDPATRKDLIDKLFGILAKLGNSNPTADELKKINDEYVAQAPKLLKYNKASEMAQRASDVRNKIAINDYNEYQSAKGKVNELISYLYTYGNPEEAKKLSDRIDPAYEGKDKIALPTDEDIANGNINAIKSAASSLNTAFNLAQPSIQKAKTDFSNKYSEELFNALQPDVKLKMAANSDNPAVARAYPAAAKKSVKELIDSFDWTPERKELTNNLLAQYKAHRGIGGITIDSAIDKAAKLSESPSFTGLDPKDKKLVVDYSTYTPTGDSLSIANKLAAIKGHPQEDEFRGSITKAIDYSKQSREAADKLASMPTDRAALQAKDAADQNAQNALGSINFYGKATEYTNKLADADKRYREAIAKQTDTGKREEGWSANKNNQDIANAKRDMDEYSKKLKDEKSIIDKNKAIYDQANPTQAAAFDQMNRDLVKQAAPDSRFYQAGVSEPAATPSAYSPSVETRTPRGDYQTTKYDTSNVIHPADLKLRAEYQAKEKANRLAEAANVMARPTPLSPEQQALQSPKAQAAMDKTFEIMRSKYPAIPEDKLRAALTGDTSELSKYGTSPSNIINGVAQAGGVSRYALWNEAEQQKIGRAPIAQDQTIATPVASTQASQENPSYAGMSKEAIESVNKMGLIADPANPGRFISPAPQDRTGITMPGGQEQATSPELRQFIASKNMELANKQNELKVLSTPSSFGGMSPMQKDMVNKKQQEIDQLQGMIASASTWNPAQFAAYQKTSVAPTSMQAAPRYNAEWKTGYPTQAAPINDNINTNQALDSEQKPLQVEAKEPEKTSGSPTDLTQDQNINKETPFMDANSFDVLDAFADQAPSKIDVIPAMFFPEPPPKKKDLVAADTGTPIMGDMQKTEMKKMGDGEEDKEKNPVVVAIKKSEGEAAPEGQPEGEEKKVAVVIVKKDGEDQDDEVPEEFRRPCRCWNDELRELSPNMLASLISNMGDDEQTQMERKDEMTEDEEAEFKDAVCFVEENPCTRFAEDIKKASGKCPGGKCIQKRGGKWRVFSAKTSKPWPAKYDSKEHALSALRGYQVSKGK